MNVPFCLPWRRAHYSFPFPLRDLIPAQPETAAQRDLYLIFVFRATRLVLRTSHRERTLWAPHQLHLEPVVVANLARLLATHAIVGVSQRLTGLGGFGLGDPHRGDEDDNAEGEPWGLHVAIQNSGTVQV